MINLVILPKNKKKNKKQAFIKKKDKKSFAAEAICNSFYNLKEKRQKIKTKNKNKKPPAIELKVYTRNE